MHMDLIIKPSFSNILITCTIKKTVHEIYIYISHRKLNCNLYIHTYTIFFLQFLNKKNEILFSSNTVYLDAQYFVQC